MSDEKFVLSICIPTYNRGEFLQKTLDSIVSQSAFLNTDEIQIVISDNCSDDNTELVGLKYSKIHPQKIKYHRHTSNIGPDINFEHALSIGNGTYLKLHNDNLLVRNGSLTELVKVIRATEIEKPIIFLTNGNRNKGNQIEIYKSLNDFVSHVSFFSTWIGGFGVWRDDFKKINDFSINANLRLVQTDILLRLLSSGKRAIVLYDVYFSGMHTGRKTGYNVAEVFGKNYLSLLKKYLEQGLLEKETFEAEKKLVLFRHIIPYYFNNDHDFAKTGFFEFMQDYAGDKYFYEAIEDFIFSKIPAQNSP